MENKVKIEITSDGWEITVIRNNVSINEKHISTSSYSSQCICGDFESDNMITDELYDALDSLFCFDVQQALLRIQEEEEK